MQSLLQRKKADCLNGRSNRWGVILAGGEGKRLLPLTRKINGDDRPKQFCKIIGDHTLLHQTNHRVSRMIEPQQILLVITEAHERYYRDQVADVPSARLLIQPRNQGTAAAILYSLMRIREMDSRAIVSFFPSDHHFSNEEALVAHIEVASAAAESHPERVILLGIVPETPEPAYGWIEAGDPLPNLSTDIVLQVNRFWEKPSQAHAFALMDNGCLWNSFVMVGRVDAFLALIRRTAPDLLDSFESRRRAFFTAREKDAVRTIYSGLSTVSFSDDVLSVSPSDLAVIRGADLGWSDLGEPGRVLSVLRRENAKLSRTSICARSLSANMTEKTTPPAVNDLERLRTPGTSCLAHSQLS